MSNERKVDRNQSIILRELNLILQREFLNNDYLKNITIHEVRLTNDMGHAKVFYSFLDNELSKDEIKNELNENKKEIRYLLAAKVDMKSVPELEFNFDDSLENANRIDEILKQAK